MSGAWSSNDWPQRWVERGADPEAWRLRMSVIIPAYGRPNQLNVLLEALTQQTYPRNLTEILVVDDGSPIPLDPRIPAGADVILLRQERDGFGLARARNLGARSATGDVVVFLDADMIPETVWLEAHARPHHHRSPLAAVGARTHVSRLEVGMDDVRSDVPIQDLLAVSDPERPQWILDRWATTNDGRIGDDIWWGMSGGNFSVDRELFIQIGGYDEEGFKEWGGEDNDLGYRIYQSGAFVVPVHEAMSWHLGPATNDADDIEERRRRIKIRLASRVASAALPRVGGVTFTVPDIAVYASVADFERGRALVGQVLSDSNEAAIGLTLGCPNPAEKALIRDFLSSESRVVVGRHHPSVTFAPITVQLAGYHWPTGLGKWLLANVGESRAAVVRIHEGKGTSTAWSTRVQRQVKDGVLGELEAYNRFSGRTVTWDDVLSEIVVMSTTDTEEWRRRAEAADAKLSEMSSRRAVRLANSLGSLARARSWEETQSAVRAIARASGLKS